MKFDISLGDKSPVIFGGFLVDSKGSEAIFWEEPQFDVEEHPERGIECFRFHIAENAMEDLTWVDDEDWTSVAMFKGFSTDEMKAMAGSDDIKERAWVYEAVGQYFGFINLNGDPSRFTAAELEAMYPEQE